MASCNCSDAMQSKGVYKKAGKWLDIGNDKDFHRLIERIEKNYAPPVS